MIDRGKVVEAIWAEVGRTGLDLYDWQVVADEAVDAAIAAILEQLREPSSDAKLAGASAITLEMMEAKANYDAACACWPAMLDAALAK